MGTAPLFCEDATAAGAMAGEYPAVLLIGDEALAFRRENRDFRAHDLGAMWWKATRLPMVFALWAGRRSCDQDALGRVARCLLESRERGVRLPHALMQEASNRTGMEQAELESYYRGLDYSLDTSALEGLLLFYHLASQQSLCPPCLSVSFLDVEWNASSVVHAEVHADA